jgi:hypothetical protein
MRLPFGIITVVPALFGTSADKVAYTLLSLTFIRLPPVALAMTGVWLTAAWAGTDVQRAKLCLVTFGPCLRPDVPRNLTI